MLDWVITMGWKFVFKTNSYITVGVKWRRKKTGSETHWESHGGHRGICVPMLAKWLQKSIPLGYRGIRFASELRLGARDFHFVSELQASSLMGITHSAFSVQKSAFGLVPERPFHNVVAVFNVYDLFVKDYAAEGAYFFNLTAMFDKVCFNYGYFALIMINLNPCNSVGHTIGFRHDYQIFQMFDPNLGLIEYSDEESFRKNVQFNFLTNEVYYRYIRCSKHNYWVLLEIDRIS
ncbi:hypothetical protein [Endozoicomonas euniceicola]|uniref:Peptidase C58 YopT-type domain-containing protein n=1 Tax=Endozoicomonas euniceicola TaxID=1234143 RepID=A0ABY6GQ29_9GAMM|nr:hypothetical protein [Endozoicomonas euniceicola]UYM14657.1 hypothetical protein NX720_17410 [Endozoicomonas euniceicola]